MLMLVRESSVAGLFYPGSKEKLISLVEKYISNAHIHINKKPKALISPHAGYIYSGPIAAYSYKTIIPYKKEYKTFVILGPSHFVYVPGVAYCYVEYFETPLGKIPVDIDLLHSIQKFDFIIENNSAHKKEHSLEVQLPFLQYIYKNEEFKILPLTVGKIIPEKIADLFEYIYKDNILIIISSDLSHYHDYYTAQQIDNQTAKAIESLNPYIIEYEQACGRIPIQGLLLYAKEKNWKPIRLDLRNSGDTAGDKKQVVGYGAWCFVEN